MKNESALPIKSTIESADLVVKFFRPAAASPFVNLYQLAPKAGILNRNPPHFHPDTIEIFAVFKGHLEWTIADQKFHLSPGDVVVIPPNIVHGAIDANLQASEVIALHIAPDELPSTVQNVANSLEVLKTRDLAVLDLVKRVFEEHQRKNALLAEISMALAVLLVSSLTDLRTDSQEIENSRLVKKAQLALTEKVGLRPTVNEVAIRLGVSAVWLTRCFIRETGESPGDWARSQRISEAKRLLATTSLSTSELAFELGYSSGQVLATAFRKECGMTPSEYRELHFEQGPPQPTEPLSYSMRIYCTD